jgi:hypothetical protein
MSNFFTFNGFKISKKFLAFFKPPTIVKFQDDGVTNVR